jgi:hypothetical protein
MASQIEGTLFEVCTCNVLCPCWVGEDRTKEPAMACWDGGWTKNQSQNSALSHGLRSVSALNNEFWDGFKE